MLTSNKIINVLSLRRIAMRLYFKPKWLRFFIPFILICSFKNVFADAPFITDAPETLDPLHAQAILYSTIDKSSAMTTIQAPALELDFGILPNIEIDAYIPYDTNINATPDLRESFPNASGIGDIDIEAKFRFLHESKYIPEMAFAPNSYIPSGDVNQGLGNGRAWYYFPITAEKTFGDWTTYAEAGYAENSAPTFYNYFFGGWALQKNINKNLMLGGELFSQGKSQDFITSYTLLNLGGSYKMSKDFSLLASVGHSILGQDHWAAYLGIAWS